MGNRLFLSTATWLMVSSFCISQNFLWKSRSQFSYKLWMESQKTKRKVNKFYFHLFPTGWKFFYPLRVNGNTSKYFNSRCNSRWWIQIMFLVLSFPLFSFFLSSIRFAFICGNKTMNRNESSFWMRKRMWL